MKFSILIATTVDRREMFLKLKKEFEEQISEWNIENDVEICFIEDEKQISIGKKRQQLLEMANGEWIAFFDSDDFPTEFYVAAIHNVICNINEIDCIGININMTTNGGNPQRCCHRLLYPEWKNNVDGWDYVRNITHFNPVKKELALKVGFKDIRFGEDKDYSDRLYPLLKKEFYIEKPMFNYRYTTNQPHNKKYGIQ